MCWADCGKAEQGRAGRARRTEIGSCLGDRKRKQIPGKNARAVFSRRKQNAVDDDGDDVDYPGRAPSITSESVSVAVAFALSVSDSDSVSVSFAANSH